MKASLVFDSQGARRRYLSVKQVAEMLAVHPCTIERWIRRRKIKAHMPFGNCKRIPADEVDRLLQETTISTPML